MRTQIEPMVGGTPELMDDYARTAADVADALNRQAVPLRDALARLRATSDPSLVAGVPDLEATLRAVAGQIRDTGATASRAAAALKTADTTARMDIVFMPADDFLRLFGSSPPVGPPAGTAPSPVPPPARPPGSPTAVDGWQRLAYERAGVAVEGWDPQGDMVGNDARIQRIWDRYGELYLTDPRRFLWAGMAKLAGATIYAGMMDLRSIVGLADVEARQRALREWITRQKPGIGDDVAGWLLSRLIDLTGDQLDDFLGRFQLMQKAIADDLLWQHEVYLAGGLAALEPLLRSYSPNNLILRQKLLDAWRAIDSGDPKQIVEGSRLLVDVEQNFVLASHYGEMRSSVRGLAFTEMLTFTAESPVPGGRAYRDARKVGGILGWLGLPSLDVPAYRWTAPDELNEVEGNVAVTEDRWVWVQEDLYPAYQRFLTEHPDEMQGLMRTPVAELAERQRRSPAPYERR